MVDPAGMERVAAQQPPDRQAEAAHRSMRRDRGQRVLAAGRVEPTPGSQRRTYPPTVRDDRPRQHPRDRASWAAAQVRAAPRSLTSPALSAVRRPAARRPPGARPAPASRSAPSCWYERPAAAGSARTTRSLPGGQVGQPLADQVPQLAPDPVADDRAADRLRHDETGPRASAPDAPHRSTSLGARSGARRPRRGRLAGRRGSRTVNSSRRRSRCPTASTVRSSGRQAGASLGATRGEDRATGPGAHAQPEAVGLRAPAVVRLVGALAHCEDLPCSCPRRDARIVRPARPATQ